MDDKKLRHLVGIDAVLDGLDLKARRNLRRRYNADHRALLAEHGWRYMPHGKESDPCTYCNDRSTEWDHVPPLFSVTEFEGACKLYRSCSDCNDKLQNCTFVDIEDRAEYLLKCHSHDHNEAWRKIKAIRQKLLSE